MSNPSYKPIDSAFLGFSNHNIPGAVPENELNQVEMLASYVGLAINSLLKDNHHLYLLNLLPLIGYLTFDRN